MAILVAPVLLILGLTLIGKPDHASAAPTPINKAVVAIAFVSAFADTEPVSSFQRVSFNVVSVRLNPSKNPNVSDTDSNWVTIKVPPGAGSSGITIVSTGNSFGGVLSTSNTVAIGLGKPEIQIELTAIENMAEIFNAQQIVAKTYRQVELVLDPATPGDVVPLCAQTFPAGEGCIDYRAKFPPISPTPGMPLSIRTSATIDLAKDATVVTPIVIQIDPGLGGSPTSFNQIVQINPTISVIANNTTVAPFINDRLGSIQGTITTNATGGFANGRQTITARLAGTDNIVESLILPNSCSGKTSCGFILYLPAAGAVFGGTNYDLVASGGTVSYAVRSNVNVIEGQNTLLALPFAVTSRSNVALTGKVADLCTGVGIQAATLDLVVPDATVSPVTDCTVIPRPAQCVVAASASTDEIGNFPLPGNVFKTASFKIVPLPANDAPYELVTTAAGFDRTPTLVTNNSGVLKCTPTAKAGTCDVKLSHGTVTGSVSLGAGGGPVSVFVAAEDRGTNNIENLQLVTIPFGTNTVPYTMNVPDSANVGVSGPVTQLDFFASTQDLFNGAPQQATGHSIAVSSAFPVPGACPSPTAVPGPDLGGMTCVGHGSVAGTVTNPMSTDTVVLSKSDGINLVQIESAPVTPQGSFDAGDYAICAPADSYTLTHYQQATPLPTPVSSVAVTLNAPVMVPTAVPSPSVVPTPCPGICQVNPPNANTGCLTCTATNANF